MSKVEINQPTELRRTLESRISSVRHVIFEEAAHRVNAEINTSEPDANDNIPVRIGFRDTNQYGQFWRDVQRLDQFQQSAAGLGSPQSLHRFLDRVIKAESDTQPSITPKQPPIGRRSPKHIP